MNLVLRNSEQIDVDTPGLCNDPRKIGVYRQIYLAAGQGFVHCRAHSRKRDKLDTVSDLFQLFFDELFILGYTQQALENIIRPGKAQFDGLVGGHPRGWTFTVAAGYQ